MLLYICVMCYTRMYIHVYVYKYWQSIMSLFMHSLINSMFIYYVSTCVFVAQLQAHNCYNTRTPTFSDEIAINFMKYNPYTPTVVNWSMS